ncbi:hypothetical protein CEXT_271911 [Caerostris extrusa]|uniref:Uncharacterized protein n=1 Tax=Caerostris extrusa TaxID=172846 RepID=A0AAV4NNI9_CAEEX|nr:hypothetical protein CEXT_271911 [Caerostris extrusa]
MNISEKFYSVFYFPIDEWKQVPNHLLLFLSISFISWYLRINDAKHCLVFIIQHPRNPVEKMLGRSYRKYWTVGIAKQGDTEEGKIENDSQD